MDMEINSNSTSEDAYKGAWELKKELERVDVDIGVTVPNVPHRHQNGDSDQVDTNSPDLASFIPKEQDNEKRYNAMHQIQNQIGTELTESPSTISTLSTPQSSQFAQFPQTSSTKKSNLRKISKYEGLSLSKSILSPFPLAPSFSFNFSLCSGSGSKNKETDDLSPTPRKRIRIVENLEYFQDQNNLQLQNEGRMDTDSNSNPNPSNSSPDTPNEDEDDETLSRARNVNDLINCDDEDSLTSESEEENMSGNIFQTNFGGEEVLWVSPPSTPLDFSLIHEDLVRAARIQVPKRFSVEIDMHFIDSATISQLLDLKVAINEAGPFNYEQICQKERQISPTTYLYQDNALKLQNLDEILDFDLTFPKEIFTQEADTFSTKEFYFADIWVRSKGFREYILKKGLDLLGEKGVLVKGFAIQDRGFDGRITKDFAESCGLLFTSLKPKADLHLDLDLKITPHSLPVELVDHFQFMVDGEMDICDISVSDDFVKNILTKTNGKGVHLFVADNPECLNIHETVREVRFQKKLYAQSIMALLSVCEGGTFIVKIFDSITLFTVGLIFLLHRCFLSVSIHKPKSSPGHLSERFLICKGKLGSEVTEEIVQFLLVCHHMVMRHEEVRKILRKKIRRRLDIQTVEVKQLVPLKVIIGHADFFEFIRLQNIRLTKSLVQEVVKLCFKVAIPNHINLLQWKESPCPKSKKKSPKKNFNNLITNAAAIATATVNQKGFSELSMNDKVKVTTSENLHIFNHKVTELVPTPTPNEFANALLAQFSHNDMNGWHKFVQKNLTKMKLEKISKNRGDWVAFPLQEGKKVLLAHEVTIYIGMGGDKVFYLDKDLKWKPVRVSVVLTKGTILYGNVTEIIFQSEFDKIFDTDSDSDRENYTSSRVETEFHILDGIAISGKYIGNFTFAQRRQLCKSYSLLLNKSSTSNFNKKDASKLSLGNEKPSSKCNLRVRDPLVLKQEPILATWAKNVVIKEGVGFYSGPMRFTNLENVETSPKLHNGLMSLGGLLFYSVAAGNVMESLQKMEMWNWTDNSRNSSLDKTLPTLETAEPVFPNIENTQPTVQDFASYNI